MKTYFIYLLHIRNTSLFSVKRIHSERLFYGRVELDGRVADTVLKKMNQFFDAKTDSVCTNPLFQHHIFY
jgi:hypothetical protein